MITPRPYQVEAIDSVFDAEAYGIQRPLIVLPTGLGKTILFLLLAQQRGGRTLILAHRDELLSQAAEKLEMIAPGADYGFVKGRLNQVERQIVIASVPTLSRPERLAQLPQDFHTVIVDEAHHAP